MPSLVRIHLVLVLMLLGILLILPTGDALEAAPSITHTIVHQERISEGTHLIKYELRVDGQNLSAYQVQVDLTNPFVKIQPMHPQQGFNLRQSVSQMANQYEAVAAINADLFHLNRPAAPFGIHLEDNRLLSSPTYNTSWMGLGIDVDQTAHILNWRFAGKILLAQGNTFPLYGYNQTYQNSNDALLYDRSWGREVASSFFSSPVLQLTIQNYRVVESRVSQESAPIPAGGYVLIADGPAADFLKRHAPVGATCQFDLAIEPNLSLSAAIGGHHLLVKDGVPTAPEKLQSPGSFRASRSAIGVDHAGTTLYLTTVDGNSNFAGLSMSELAHFMAGTGSHRALNLDGGGSSTLAIRPLGETRVSVVNQPRHGFERALPNALGILNTAARTNAARLFLRGANTLVVGSETSFAVTGHDQHYLPLDLDPSEISWEVAHPELASITGGTLSALKPGRTEVRVQYAGINETRAIRILGADDIASIRVQPIALNLLPGQEAKLDVTLITHEGQRLSAGPSTIAWDASIGSVRNNTFYAGDLAGTGTLTAQLNGVREEIPVRIGQQREPFFTFREWQTTAFHGRPETVDGAFEMQTDPQFIVCGQRSGRLDYRFPHDITGLSYAYARLGSGQISMDTQNVGISAHIYGNNSGLRLRAEVIDADGETRHLDLARSIDWTGWRRIEGMIDPGWPQPLILRSLYLVYDPDRMTAEAARSGTLYLDCIEMIKGRHDATARTPAVTMWIGSTQYQMGNQLGQMSDAAPFIESGRTLIPVRFLGQALGAEVNWTADAATGLTDRVILENAQRFILLEMANTEMTVIDKKAGTAKVVTLDVAPTIREGRTYLPFRAIGETGFGSEVGYATDSATGRVERVWVYALEE